MRSKPWMILALALAVVGPSAAQPSEEQVVVDFVARAGGGSAADLLEFMRENFDEELWGRRSEEDWERMAAMITGRHEGLEILTIDSESPGAWRAVTRDRGGMILTFSLDFTGDAPARIAGVGIEAGGGPPRGGPQLAPFEVEGSGCAALEEALGGWFERLGDRFAGTVLVAWRGEPIFSGAYGLATRRWGVPNRLETRFDVGSINKTFTQVAIGQLHLAGELSFDDTIADHLPDYPNAETAGRITIRQLLEHSSGLGDIFTDRYHEVDKARLRRPADFFFLFADRPLLFEPGTSRRYSNGGYMVLGAIVEAVSGVPYADYVVEHVFAPAGMERTGFFAKDEPVPDVAVGYTTVGLDGEPGDKLRNNLFRLPVVGNSAGSAQSTVEDLFRFDEALRESRLLPPRYSAWVFGGEEPRAGDGGGAAERIMTGIGYAGGAPGVSAVVESDGELTVVVLSNQDEPGAEAVARALTQPLRRHLGG